MGLSPSGQGLRFSAVFPRGGAVDNEIATPYTRRHLGTREQVRPAPGFRNSRTEAVTIRVTERPDPLIPPRRPRVRERMRFFASPWCLAMRGRGGAEDAGRAGDVRSFARGRVPRCITDVRDKTG